MAKAKWPKKQGKYLCVPLFNAPLWVFYTREDMIEAMTYLGVSDVRDFQDCNGTCQWVESKTGGGAMIVIGIFKWLADVCVHEAVHATQFVLEFVGSECIEVEAYMCQEIFKHIHDNLPKYENNA